MPWLVTKSSEACRCVVCVLFVTVVSLLAGCCTMPRQSQQPAAAAESKPKWHSVVMIPRTNHPAIHFYNKINPIWWFGNVDEPRAPDWYRPGGRFRNFAWHMRNPLENFSNYVIGVADKKSVRSGRYPTQNSNPHGGWNFAVTRWRIMYLPFIDCKHRRFEFYFGWRERGNFGIKLNFRPAPPKPPQQNPNTPTAETPAPLK
jgi:hypothetical protein